MQASELGFSSVPMSITPQAERIEGVANALGLPEHLVPQIMITIGQPADDTVSSASVDFYDENKVHYNGYQ